MVKIRLRRMGAKKAPFYRIVVADSRYPRDGRFIEEIGTYNPLTNPAEIKVKLERNKQLLDLRRSVLEVEEERLSGQPTMLSLIHIFAIMSHKMFIVYSIIMHYVLHPFYTSPAIRLIIISLIAWRCV